jgi:AAA domain
MISLADIHEAPASLPSRLLIHGLPGVGKTTLASKFPHPVFLQTEDGTPAGLKLPTFGLLQAYGDARDALAALGSEPHDYKTVVLDSLDKTEGIIWSDVCETNKWPSIEAPGYGRGYVIADKWWRDLLAGLDWLRRERGMTIVLLAHSAIETVNDPRAPSYTSYQLRLHKRARGLVQDEMDVIAFLATDVAVISEDAGFSKKRNRANGGSARWLHFEGRPAFVAKSRFDLPAKILCPKDFDVSTSLAPLFPKVAPGNQSVRSQTKETISDE